MRQIEKVIYIHEKDIPVTKTRKQLIRYFLRGKSYTTYENPECTIVQCSNKGEDSNKGHAWRSITDLHLIVKSRFPKTSLEAVVKIVYDFIKEDKNVVLVWCTMINKVVVKYYDNPNKTYITKHSRDHYYSTKGVDGYSLKDFDQIRKNLNID